jgi:cupin fold WbuC family metalloprotein
MGNYMSAEKIIDQKLFDSLTTQAQASPRRRKNFNFHADDAAICHRLLNALEMDSYIQPHRHLDPTKDETLIVVRGKLGAIFFDDAGNVTHKVVIEAGGDNVGLHTPSGVFHSFVALAPNSVIFEAKAGPYMPVNESEKASWAPAENSSEAQAYLKKMLALFA